MLNFYPGPSKVYPQVADYLQDAYNSGILSINHRSESFMQICRKTLELLHKKLNIPADYAIVFVSSATECWEIVAQSFTEKGGLHFYSGAFGQKWFEYAAKIKSESHFLAFDPETVCNFPHKEISPEIVCLTQNETSNGTQVREEEIEFFREKNPASLIACDVTSSLGGMDLPIEKADIWLASVQKCLGLPAGLGLLIVSPKAIERAKTLNDIRFYNSFLFMYQNIHQFQTHYTPNVLNIYLLMRVLEQVENVKVISEKIKNRASDLYYFFENHPIFKPLIQNSEVRSDTVICIKAKPEQIEKIKQKALTENIILGNGYGIWKNTTFRIANFPQITDEEVEKLKEYLYANY